MNYGFVKEVKLSFDQVLSKVTEELKKEGFGILTVIDVKEKFKEKLNIDSPRYHILGACNPKLAHKAILTERNIGLLLPCNVIIYEREHSVYVGIIKPTRAMSEVENDKLKEIAQQAETKLENVFKKI